MYASSMRRETTPEVEVERFASVIDKHGFKCIKIKIGEMMGRDQNASPGPDSTLYHISHETLGDEIEIHADGNGGYSATKAIRIGRILEEYRYFHLEEPCSFPDLEATAEVVAAVDMPVAGGEQDFDLTQFRRMIDTPAVDIVQPNIGYIGGVSLAPQSRYDGPVRGDALHTPLRQSIPADVHPSPRRRHARLLPVPRVVN